MDKDKFENASYRSDEIILPLLKENKLSIFSNKKVIIFIAGGVPTTLCKILKRNHIDVIGFMLPNKNPNKIIIMKSYLESGVPYFTQSKFEKLLLKRKKEIIVQTVTSDALVQEHLESLIKQKGGVVSGIAANHITMSFQIESYFHQFRLPHIFYFWKIILYARRFMRDKNLSSLSDRIRGNQMVYICTPAKTADIAIGSTFDKHRVGYFNFWQRPSLLAREIKKNTNFRLIIGVREPISQNLSLMFEMFAIDYFFQMALSDLIEFNKSKEFPIENYKTLFKKGHGNVQNLWDLYIDKYINHSKIDIWNLQYIQFFFYKLKEHFFDILAHPFDQEKGYTIIKEGNTEVFIYQLEKLNNIVPELSDWVGVPFDKIEKGNVGEDKWIGDTYKQAQKEIQITQEYFDKCFDEPYVKHFYSEEDIEKFKARWKPHIKKE